MRCTGAIPLNAIGNDNTGTTVRSTWIGAVTVLASKFGGGAGGRRQTTSGVARRRADPPSLPGEPDSRSRWGE